MKVTIITGTEQTTEVTSTYMERKTRYSKVLVEKSYTRKVTTADAEVNIMGKVRTIKVERNWHSNGWQFHGVAVKYLTGEKVWNGTATLWDKSGNVTISAGLDNRAKHNTCTNVLGWHDEYEVRQSQHIGA